jgi:hypothetical protein
VPFVQKTFGVWGKFGMCPAQGTSTSFTKNDARRGGGEKRELATLRLVPTIGLKRKCKRTLRNLHAHGHAMMESRDITQD